MKRTRRQWLKRGLIFVPATFGIVKAQGVFVRSPAFRVEAAGGGGSVAFDAVSNASGTYAKPSSDPQTFNHAQGSLTNGYIVVALSWNDQSIDGVTYDGVSMSTLGTPIFTGYGSYGALYGLAVGTKGSGTYTISVNPSSPIGEFTGACMSFSGAHQSTAPTYASASGGNASPSVNVSSATGRMVVDVVSWYYGEATATGTQRWQRSAGEDVTTDGASQTKIGSTTVTMNWSLSIGHDWGIAAASLYAA